MSTRASSSAARWPPDAHTLPNAVAPPEVVVDPSLADAWLSVDKRRFERIMTNLLENAALYGGGRHAVAAEPGPARHDGLADAAGVRRGPRSGGHRVGALARSSSASTGASVSGRRGDGTGTGLGLALVAEHVRLNGGSVRAEETDGGGARFVIELPMFEQDPS